MRVVEQAPLSPATLNAMSLRSIDELQNLLLSRQTAWDLEKQLTTPLTSSSPDSHRFIGDTAGKKWDSCWDEWHMLVTHVSGRVTGDAYRSLAYGRVSRELMHGMAPAEAAGNHRNS